VPEQKEPEYRKLIKHFDIQPREFLMVGNSLKSDILPVLHLGGWGFHVPYHTTWEFEKLETHVEHPNLRWWKEHPGNRELPVIPPHRSTFFTQTKLTF